MAVPARSVAVGMLPAGARRGRWGRGRPWALPAEMWPAGGAAYQDEDRWGHWNAAAGVPRVRPPAIGKKRNSVKEMTEE